MTPAVSTLNGARVRQATLEQVHALTPAALRVSARPRPPGPTATVAWPWTVAQAGGAFLGGPHGGVIYGLSADALDFASTPEGQNLTSALTSYDWGSKTVDPSLAASVQGSGLFAPALDQVKADAMMRSLLVGIVHNVNLDIGGELGGSGFAIDVASPQDLGGYTYEVGQVGLALGGNAALAIGAVSSTHDQMTCGVTTFSVGVNLGPGMLLTVLMTGDTTGLIGFVAAVGVGVGVTGAVGWGSSWAF